MDVVPGAEDELLDRVLRLRAHLSLELVLVLGYEEAPAAFGPVVFDYHGPVYVLCSLKTHGYVDPGLKQPLSLHLSVALPG